MANDSKTFGRGLNFLNRVMQLTVASDSLFLSIRNVCVIDIVAIPFFVTSTLDITCLLSVTCFFLNTTGDANNVPPIPRLSIFSNEDELLPNREFLRVATLCCAGCSIELSPLERREAVLIT